MSYNLLYLYMSFFFFLLLFCSIYQTWKYIFKATTVLFRFVKNKNLPWTDLNKSCKNACD